MSLPENAKWLYSHEPEEGSPEAWHRASHL